MRMKERTSVSSPTRSYRARVRYLPGVVIFPRSVQEPLRRLQGRLQVLRLPMHEVRRAYGQEVLELRTLARQPTPHLSAGAGALLGVHPVGYRRYASSIHGQLVHCPGNAAVPPPSGAPTPGRGPRRRSRTPPCRPASLRRSASPNGLGAHHVVCLGEQCSQTIFFNWPSGH